MGRIIPHYARTFSIESTLKLVRLYDNILDISVVHRCNRFPQARLQLGLGKCRQTPSDGKSVCPGQQSVEVSRCIFTEPRHVSTISEARIRYRTEQKESVK